MCIDLAWLEKFFQAFIASNTPFVHLETLVQATGSNDEYNETFKSHFHFLMDNDLIKVYQYQYDDDPLDTSSNEKTYRITAEGLKMASALLNRSVYDCVEKDLNSLSENDISFHQVRYLCDKHAYNLTVGKSPC